MLTLTFSQEIAHLSGELTRHTIPQLSDKVTAPLFSKKQMVLDLIAVKKIDTAGLAWLLAQVELADINACQLTLSHLPPDLMKLATLSGVDSFLPVYTTA